MKQTLYQILGVEPQATQEEIERAYRERLGAYEADLNRDPNMLVALRQAKEVLTNEIQRAAYDGDLANRAAPAPADAMEEQNPTFLQRNGNWVAGGAVLMALVLWWSSGGPPPAPKAVAPKIAAPVEQESPSAVQPRNEPAPLAVAPAKEAVPDNPMVGQWSCYEAVSGSSSRYDFTPDGALTITEAGGRVLSHRYQVAGKTLKIGDATQANALAIEEWTQRKMVLNMGAEGRRMVCKR